MLSGPELDGWRKLGAGQNSFQVARIAKNVIPVISGRVLAQVSTNYAYDKAKVVEHARRYAKAFNDVGITNDRFCIKIPVTSAGVQAAIELGADGIATLGTTLFSVPQAIAAAQAGMHAVSMYLNEPRAHAEAGVWPDVADPATQAPMAARHVQIRAAYDERAAQGHKVPQMKTASFCVAPDVLAAAELGADHVTVGIPVLTDLMEYSTMPEYRPGMWKVPFKVQAEDQEREWVAWQPRSVSDPEIQALRKSDPLAKSPECKVATFDTDYTVGDVLDKANDEDPATQFRLQFAIKRFADMEAQSKKFLDGLMAA